MFYKLVSNLKENYTPLYFLASLGCGGLSISFFIYLMFMVPHPNTPLATFNDIFPLVMKFNFVSALIILDLIAITFFAFWHFRLLIWNIKEFGLFKTTEAFMVLKSSNSEVTLMAIPLTYAMSINVCFVLGALFVPNLWSVVEYLFPFALLGFFAVGVYALKIFSEYFTRIIVNGDFDFINNNNLSQMIAIFAFSMIAVGFAAPGAMSHNKVVSAIGLFFSIFFATISISLIILKTILGMKSILQQGIAKDASVSLWIMIPILTLLGITFIRLTFGFIHNFEGTKSFPGIIIFIITTTALSLQIMFGVVGYFVMKRLNYFNEYINGSVKKASSYAIICPGVAFFVFGFFFVSFGLVQNNIISKFSIAYFLLLAPFIYVQYKTVLTVLKLNNKLIRLKSKG